jgi:signal transduction histidine kinase/ligand-binding sensor domain-containing protein
VLSDQESEPFGGEVRQVVEAGDGAVWMVQPRALWKWKAGVREVYPLPKENPPTVNLHELLLETSRSGWVAASDRLLCFRDQAFEPAALPVADLGFPPRVYHVRKGAESGQVYGATLKLLFVRSSGAGWSVVPTPTYSAEFFVSGIPLEVGEVFWLCSEQGVFARRNGTWRRLFGENLPFPLTCQAALPDRNRNLWIGTANGLVRISERVVTCSFYPAVERVLSVRALSEERILAGLAGGGVAEGGAHGLSYVNKAWPVHSVSSLLTDRSGTLWFGTIGYGIWMRRGAQLVLQKQWGGAVRRDRGRDVYAVAEDRKGQIWAGTGDGLMRIESRGQDIALVPCAELPGLPVVSLLPEEDALWIGYRADGLIRRAADGTWTHYGESDGLPGAGVHAICRDGEGVLWLGGPKGAALQRGAASTAFSPVGREHGLDGAVVQIVPDGQGRLWLGTPQGIRIVKRAEVQEVLAGRRARLSVRRLGVEDGMASPECTGGFSFEGAAAPTGRLWFATARGVAHVEPLNVCPTGSPPHVLLEEVRGGGETLWKADGTGFAGGAEAPQVTIPAGSHGIEIRFTALDYGAPDRLRFQYRLEGAAGERWSDISERRSALYEWLPPGRHRFRVVACAADGTWNEAGAGVTLEVRPWFWQTGWFAGVALLGASALAAGAMRRRQRLRYRWRLQQMEKQQLLYEERARIARDIHDDLGAGLTEIGMLGEWLRQDVAALLPDASAARLDRLCEAAGELTRSTDEIVWAVNPANDTLRSFLGYAGQYAEQFLSAAGLRYRLDIPLDTPEQPLSSRTRHHLFMILREALVNVAKHARASLVLFRVRIGECEWSIAVEDNGCGFEREAVRGTEAGRDGLASFEARAQEIGGRLALVSAPGQGTCVEIALPLSG